MAKFDEEHESDSVPADLQHLVYDEASVRPTPGTWAHTAGLMSEIFPEGPGDGLDWDDWKDQMKEG